LNRIGFLWFSGSGMLPDSRAQAVRRGHLTKILPWRRCMTFSTTELYKTLCDGPFIIAGPCVLESYELALETARIVREAADRHAVTAIFKSSFDKANRTSASSFRGPGMTTGLEWLARIREETGLPVITDIHEPAQAAPVAAVADILQIPAFLCRQTALLQAAAATGSVVNVKKGQFVAPWDMGPVVEKLHAAGNLHVMLTERGASFGYNNLVVDFRSFSIMRSLNVPVISMPPIPYSFRAGRVPAPEGTEGMFLRWPAQLWQQVQTGFFWNVIPTPTRRCATAPTAGPRGA
jgi:2-dehydro-3-deoxyphosphooctonate aldolase (KDO 8-P synthase)